MNLCRASLPRFEEVLGSIAAVQKRSDDEKFEDAGEKTAKPEGIDGKEKIAQPEGIDGKVKCSATLYQHTRLPRILLCAAPQVQRRRRRSARTRGGGAGARRLLQGRPQGRHQPEVRLEGHQVQGRRGGKPCRPENQPVHVK